jgi:hypothetical protein
MANLIRSKFFFPLLLVLLALTGTVITFAISGRDSMGALAAQSADSVDSAGDLDKFNPYFAGNTETHKSASPSPANREDIMVTAELFADPARATAPLVRSGQGSPPPGEVDAGRAPRQSVFADRGESLFYGKWVL